jgi:hypothetical protein
MLDTDRREEGDDDVPAHERSASALATGLDRTAAYQSNHKTARAALFDSGSPSVPSGQSIAAAI